MSDGRQHRILRWLRKRVLITLAVVYALSYAALMNRTTPAIDRNHEISFRSSFRISELQATLTNGVSAHYVPESLFNYVYLPLDYPYHKFFSSTYRDGFERDFHRKDWFIMR